MSPKSDKNVLVKLSAPARIGGMLTRDTFDVPRTKEGSDFMIWWDKAASAERDAVLIHSHTENVCVTEAWNNLREDFNQ